MIAAVGYCRRRRRRRGLTCCMSTSGSRVRTLPWSSNACVPNRGRPQFAAKARGKDRSKSKSRLSGLCLLSRRPASALEWCAYPHFAHFSHARTHASAPTLTTRPMGSTTLHCMHDAHQSAGQATDTRVGCGHERLWRVAQHSASSCKEHPQCLCACLAFA